MPKDAQDLNRHLKSREAWCEAQEKAANDLK